MYATIQFEFQWTVERSSSTYVPFRCMGDIITIYQLESTEIRLSWGRTVRSDQTPQALADNYWIFAAELKLNCGAFDLGGILPLHLATPNPKIQ